MNGSSMRTTAALVAAAALAVGAGRALAQANPRGTASWADGAVTIDYGRPATKGRDVLGLIGPDSYWRMGADQATTLETKVPLEIGGTVVPPGKYTLMAYYGGTSGWKLVVAEGSEGGRPVSVEAEAPLALETGGEHVERLTIELEEAGEGAARFVLSWGTAKLVGNLSRKSESGGKR